MVVVRHQAPRVHLPAGLRAGLAQALEEGRLGLVGAEDVRPVVAPVQDVIDPGLGFHSQRSRHAGLSAGRPPVSTQTPRPDPLSSLTLSVPFSQFPHLGSGRALVALVNLLLTNWTTWSTVPKSAVWNKIVIT